MFEVDKPMLTAIPTIEVFAFFLFIPELCLAKWFRILNNKDAMLILPLLDRYLMAYSFIVEKSMDFSNITAGN